MLDTAQTTQDLEASGIRAHSVTPTRPPPPGQVCGPAAGSGQRLSSGLCLIPSCWEGGGDLGLVSPRGPLCAWSGLVPSHLLSCWERGA